MRKTPEKIRKSYFQQQQKKGEEITEKGLLEVAKKLEKEKQQSSEREKLSTAGKGWIGSPLYCGKFQSVCQTLAKELVDVCITDPPYAEEYLPLFTDLVDAVEPLLKPGGSLFVMSGQSFLPEVYRRLTASGRLTYFWTISMFLTLNNSNSIFPKKVMVAWKPVIWLTKGVPTGLRWHHDVVGSDEPEKQLDRWQQNTKSIAQLIEFYSEPGDIVLDPMMGTGSIGVSAIGLARQFIGIDISKENVEVARGRMKNVNIIAN